MQMRSKCWGGVAGGAAVLVLLGLLTPTSVLAQAPPGAPRTEVPRTEDGKPDLSGIWQALSTASFDLEDHSAQLGIPAGQGVVEGGKIPYQSEGLEQRGKNFEMRMTEDPVRKCLQPGVPRATYMPFPFQIAQSPELIAIMYTFVHAQRLVYMDGSSHSPIIEAGFDSWMGDSRGHWDGDTLVVDVIGLNNQTWFDDVGNFHSEVLHVVERYTPMGPDHLWYEATIDDPQVFTRPWKISLHLYRHVKTNDELLPYDCFIYLQDGKFGPLPEPIR